jgi:hypothetical protein
LGAENLGKRITIGKQEQQEEQENKKYRFYLSTKLHVSLQSLTRATYKPNIPCYYLLPVHHPWKCFPAAADLLAAA